MTLKNSPSMTLKKQVEYDIKKQSEFLNFCYDVDKKSKLW